MMGMPGIFTMCCGALFLALTSVSAVQKLHSINSLKKINYSKSVPKHSLLLLYWFANVVEIDENNVIWMTFDPNTHDYGSHYYHNSEGVLEERDRNNAFRYYTIGNLNQPTSMPLPPYVVRPRTEYVGRNRDRIIVRIREQNTQRTDLQRIEHVYITQHYDISENRGTGYDPAHTYMIYLSLIRHIREFSVGQNQQQLLQLRNRFGGNADESQLRDIINTWGPDLAGLGLLLCIVIQAKDSPNQRNRQEERPKHLDDDSKRKSNVHRDVRNQDYVLVRNADEDLEANNRMTNRQEKRPKHLDDDSKRKSNVHRDVRIQDNVPIRNADVDLEANNWMTNRQSGVTSAPRNCKICCGIAIFCSIIVVVIVIVCWLKFR
ncbi:uncharacterized protein LOC130188078 [Pseudoliparis swirei]|uniref:uncharacterized protein LOC130188078 n=1 Tax=Pseudoliparis swirei TaxID=2059687 RepID=UPI0024BE947E|nr:uncharacterized protein LOC130188078 [Pseudoliparis swirei]